MSTIQATNRPYTFVSLIISMLLVFSLAPPQWAHAATLTVDTLLDENDGSCSVGDCSLRDAIQVAAAGDAITFSVTGTIILTLGQLSINKTLTISGPGPGSLTVDGNHSSRVFYVSGFGLINFSGLTIANGSADSGGGMENKSYSNSTLTNMIFSGNSAISSGGGMFNYNGNSALTDVTFSANSAYDGGGMENGSYGVTTLTNVTFSDNTATNQGGGIFNYDGTCMLMNVTFGGNSAYAGGGMENGPRGHSTLTNVNFRDNSAEEGGGLYNMGVSSILMKVAFSGNSAIKGGGMYENPWGYSTLTNVTYSDNSATFGGGLYFLYGSPYLMNVTISSNSASSVGGGLYVAGGSGAHILKNTLLAGNSAPAGPDCSGNLSSYGHNLIQNATNCIIWGDETDNIYGIDPLLGPLKDNGGDTLTHALLPGSPAIDAAAPTDPYHPVPEDQRGITRPVGPANDIGAFELVYQVHQVWLPAVLK